MFETVTDALQCPTILLTTVLAILLIYALLFKRPKNLPPGPWGLPIVGYGPFMTSTPHEKLKKLAETYGDIMSVKIFGKTIIHLNSYEAIREAFVEKGDEFAGRPQDFSFFQWVVDGLGIAQTEGPIWKEHRRFALHTLRDFGFGKLSLEARVQEIADDLLKILQDTKGEPHDINDNLSNCSANVICSLVFNKHFDHDDPDFLAMRKRVTTVLKSLQGTILFTEFPLLKLLPIRFVPGFNKLIDVKQGFHELCERMIKEHQDNFDPENLRDYMDVYLNERRIAEAEGRLAESSFSLERLKAIALNLFIAGTETISTQLHWSFKLLMVNEDVQKRIQAELDDVVGRERKPSILDRPNLPYTEAAILEMQRFSSMLALVPVHSNPEESELRGFTIPKRSLILANLWSVNQDQSRYVYPEEFKPSRFLGADGKVDNKDTLIPFSMGKRSCPGESLARMELFLFLTSVLQRFSIQPQENETNLSFDCHTSIARRLLPYKLCAKPRY